MAGGRCREGEDPAGGVKTGRLAAFDVSERTTGRRQINGQIDRLIDRYKYTVYFNMQHS
jgi:hypothetical protein